MNIELGKLFERASLFLVILGAIFLLLAALGGLPIENNNTIESSWRNILAITGIALLSVGIFLILKEQKNEKELGKGNASEGVIKFDSDKDVLQYILRRIRDAKKSISDLTYQDFRLVKSDDSMCA